MISKKNIMDNVLLAIRRQKSEKDRDTVDSILQKHVFQVSEQHSFHKLRQAKEIDLSDAGEEPAQGMWLPSDLAGIDTLRNVSVSSDGFIRRDESHIDPDEKMFRYYSYIPTGLPLFEADDVIVNQGDDYFVSGDLDAMVAGGLDPVGEWVRFDTEYGFHEIVEVDNDQYKIEPVYTGETLSFKHFEVRPRGTQKLVVVKPNEDQVVSGKVKLHYWTYHPPLHKDTDVILMPHAGLIELLVTREALMVIARRQLSSNTYIRDVEEAWNITRRLNPSFPRATGPRDNLNKQFTMNKTLFKQRD